MKIKDSGYNLSKGLFVILSLLIVVTAATLEFSEFKVGGKIGFLMLCVASSGTMSILFVLTLITTWKRDWLKVTAGIFFFVIFIVCSENKFNFSLATATIISAGTAVFPFFTTFLFRKKEKKERLEEKLVKDGYKSQGYAPNGAKVFSDKNLNLVFVKNGEIIGTIGLDWFD
jgi:hypothetical protein